ncbi:MAG: BatA domain-containing protein [Thermodesulfobacteriota bacterium]|nr:BatA domain-containing protein [Thermodesulfobacteriota bacterium]
MSLTFLNPLFLFGLAAGILPILIHRLTQRKAIPRKFSAVRLLLQSQRVTAKPQRLKHLLLLALRILAVLGIVFMMARPVLTRPGIAAFQSGGAKVIILDNSLSMGFREQGGERYDLAKKGAKEALKGFEGQVTIIPTVDVQTGQTATQGVRWIKTEEALKELETLPLSFGRGDTASALGLAYQRLKDLKTSKQILILSDMARGDWEALDLSKLGVVSDADVIFLRIGGQGRDPNFCVKSVSLIEGEAVVGAPARLEVVVSNFYEKPGTPLIQLYLSGTKVDQKSIDLKAGEDGKVYFELFLEKPGWIDGEVRLSGDGLSSDDIFYFPLKVREKVKVLIVDGDPRTSLKASESYYLINALRPGGLESSPFLVRVITEAEVASVDLRPYDAIFLLNATKPYPSRLASFLELGKPVFIFLGDRASPEEYNAFTLLPWRIGEPRDLGQKPERIAQIDPGREALNSLSRGSESLKSASFHRYFKIEGSTRNLLTLGNQDPLLVEAEIGKSRLFLFTSSADLDWNDLPLKAAYLPLIQGLLKEAIGLTGSSLPAGLRVGEPFREQVRPVQIRGPQGGPGIYLFSLPLGDVWRGVNPPYEESDLAKMAEGELQKKFGTIAVKVIEYQEGTLKDLQAGRKELWPLLLAFLMVVLAVEMGLANGAPWKKS